MLISSSSLSRLVLLQVEASIFLNDVFHKGLFQIAEVIYRYTLNASAKLSASPRRVNITIRVLVQRSISVKVQIFYLSRPQLGENTFQENMRNLAFRENSFLTLLTMYACFQFTKSGLYTVFLCSRRR